MALEIFKLVGSVFVDTDDANKSLETTDTKAKGVGSTFLNGVKSAAKFGAGIAAAAGTAAIAMGVTAVKSADELKKAINGFAASTGTTTEELEGYEDALKNIYANNYGESFEDVANTMATIKQNMKDLDAVSLQSVTENAIALKDTFGFETEESVRAVKMMMDQFGVSADEAYNLVAQGAQSGLNKNGDLLDSINEYSVHFENLGMNAEDMFNALANGTAEGTFSVDKLGDAVKEFGVRVKDGSDATKEGFKTIGLNADEMAKKFGEGGEVAQEAFQDTIAALAAMEDPIEQNTAGVSLFGTMWEDLGTDGVLALANLNGEISSTTDAMAAINEVKYDSFGEAITGLKRQVETNILIPLGESILPILNRFANWFATDGVTYIQNFATFIQPIFSVVFGVIQTGFAFIQPIVEQFFSLLTNLLGNSDITVNTVFGNIKNYYDTIIAPLFEAIKPALQAIFDSFNEIWNGISTLFVTAWDIIQKTWETVGKPLFDLVVEGVNILSEVFAEIMPEISALFEDVCNTFSELWQNNLKPVFDVIKNFIETTLAPIFKKVFEGIGNQIKTTFGVIKELWEKSLKPIFTGITEFLNGAFTGNWKKAFEGISKIFKGVFDGLVTIAKNPINMVIGVINGMINGVCSGINTVIKAVNRLSFTVPDWVPGIGGNSFGFNLSEVTAPQIPKLAEGGIVDEGQMFIAREAGAELVGQAEGKTTVMNNDQIIEAVSAGVYDAVLDAFTDAQNGLQQVIIDALNSANIQAVIGDTVLFNSVQKSAIKHYRRTNTAPFPV